MSERLHVAIIDDNQDAAKSLRDYFGQRAQVIIFTSCEELLRTEMPFDAFVTDTNMGKWNMDGIECAKEIHFRNPDAVIVGTSVISENEGNPAAKEFELRTLYKRFEANDFINRADGPEEIVARVMELLNAR